MKTFVLFGLLALSSCQLPYIIKSAYNQASLLNQRIPLEKALQDPTLTPDEHRKLELAKRVKEFCETELGLNVSDNFTSYVKLKQPYVTYVVNASPKWELKTHEWSYPIVGRMPYKGFFKESDAKEEAEELRKTDLDVYVRGVSAYSTLGWFKDPLLSSMLRYQDHDLVDTIIHETIHANIYIKNNADFNERLAVFLGGKGMEKFYNKAEGANSKNLKIAKLDQIDSLAFSKFITEEISNLRAYYKSVEPTQRDEVLRQKRIDEIKDNFKVKLEGQLLTKNYSEFPKRPLNNARLLLFGTYMEKLEDFQKLYEKVDENFLKFIETIKSISKDKDPQDSLHKIVSN